MKRLAMLGLGLALLLAACGSSSRSSAAQRVLQAQADRYAIGQLEVNWHRASSTHDVNLMMSLWAPDATFVIGPQTFTGRDQIWKFFANKAGPFRPQHHWVSESPAFKTRITVSGGKATLYFECVYVDLKTQKVVSVVGADSQLRKINGKWLITSSAAATPTLAP